MKRLVLTLGIGICSLLTYSQQGKLTMKGEVANHDGASIDNYKIIVLDTKTNDTLQSFTESGKCKITLALDQQYKILFLHPDYMGKFITVSTDRTKYDNYKFDFDIVLGQSSTINTFDKPIGHVKFNYGFQAFEYNATYTRKKRKEYNTLLVTSNP